jgi:hypothetical protein
MVVGGAVAGDARMAAYIVLGIILYLQSDNNRIFYNPNEARPVPTGQLPIASLISISHVDKKDTRLETRRLRLVTELNHVGQRPGHTTPPSI